MRKGFLTLESLKSASDFPYDTDVSAFFGIAPSRRSARLLEPLFTRVKNGPKTPPGNPADNWVVQSSVGLLFLFLTHFGPFLLTS